MQTKILLDSGSGVIGIAILASIQSAIVHANVDAGHTAVLSENIVEQPRPQDGAAAELLQQ